MADMKTRVLTVDTGNAINNVKEFKQHIEDLKGTLLTLEKGTEEYNSVANELRESQQKLNEVMDVAKGKGEAVAGSYDNLVATMRELKKQWRATADEAERNDLGKQILDINNQLKKLDASTGNFQRNVGDYENAFVKSFDKILGLLGKNNSAIGQLSSTLKNILPLLKQFSSLVGSTSGGIKGLTGGVAGLSGSFSGLLKILGRAGIWGAVGALAVFAIKEIIRANTKVVDLTRDAERLSKEFEQWQKNIDDLDKNNRLEQLRMELEGISETIIKEKSLENAKTKLNSYANEVTKYLKELRRAANQLNEEYRNLNEGTLKELGFSTEEIDFLTKDYATTLERLGYTQEEINDNQQIFNFYIQKTDEVQEKLVKNDAFKKMSESLKKLLENMPKLINQVSELSTQVDEAELRDADRAKRIVERAQESLMTESQLLAKRFKKDRELVVKEFGEGSEEVATLTREYYKKLRDIAFKNKVDLTPTIFNINSGDYDKIKSQLDDFFVTITDKVTEVSNKAYVAASQNLNKQLEDGEITYVDYLQKVNELNMEYVKKSGEEKLKLTKEALKKEYDINKDKLKKGEEEEVKQIDKIAGKRKEELFKYLKEGKINQKKYDEEILALDEQTAKEKTNIHSKYDETRLNLDKKHAYDSQQAELKAAKETLDKKIELYSKEKSIKNIEIGIEFDTKEMEQKIASKASGLFKYFGNLNPVNIFSTQDIEDSFKLIQDKSKALYDSNKANLESSIAAYEDYLQTVEAGSLEALEAESALTASKIQLRQLEAERIIETQEEVDNYEQQLAERRKERVQQYITGIQSVGNLLSSFASMQKSQLDQEVASGKIKEAEAKKRFEQVKKLQIGAAVMEMGAGVVGAISQAYQNLGPVMAPIVAAINSAAVIASSIVRINSIKQQQYGSNSNSPSVSTPNVTEVVNEFTPKYTQNVTTDSELTNLQNAFHSSKFYVSVTDINDVQNKVKVTENETSF